MADIKTHLRELSVAITVGLLSRGKEISPSDLYDSEKFYEYASAIVKNEVSSAKNILKYDKFPEDLKLIIDNGYKLGVKIFEHPYFNIPNNVDIKWLGNDTQKGNPVDIVVGEYAFSLKEDSFILKNMGLYNLLNNQTGSTYPRGVHVFSTFAQEEYEQWFDYTWKSFVKFLKDADRWLLVENEKIYSAHIFESLVIMQYNDYVSRVPIDIKSFKDYMKYTVSETREKVFSKWINKIFSKDKEYLKLKKHCSETAGKQVCKIINSKFNPNLVCNFLQIYDFDYFYAKTTSQETTLLHVPSKSLFSLNIEFLGCSYNVPGSQLNIISVFRNIKTGKTLEFRNECRFSHGQFNGTPEAKMYVVKETPLTELYEPV